jgi:MFS family permease
MIEQIRRRMSGLGDSAAVRAEIAADYPDFRRNYLLGIINGLLYNNGLSFFNRTTIIPVFLSMLGAPSVLISFTALFEALGWHLPQLFASKFVVHKPQKMPLYGMAAVIRVVGLSLAIVAAYLAASLSSFWVLTIFILGYGIFAIAGGFAGLVFTEIVAKTCPKEKRGTYFGWRAILSGIAGLYVGVGIIKPIFAGLGYPHNYFTVFSIGTTLIAISFYLFTRQREPLQSDLPEKRSLRLQLTRALEIFRADHAFRRFVLFRGLMMLWFAGIPFFMLFAKDRLGASEEQIGIYISWEFAGMIVANTLWGYISNRIGNRVLLIVGCSLGIVVSALLLLFDAGVALLPAWSFGAIFFLGTAVDSGVGNGGINYALEIVPEGERPTYVGLMNTTLAMALTLAAIAGSLRDIVGYTGLFMMTGCVALVSLVIILRLPEPRKRVRSAEL